MACTLPSLPPYFHSHHYMPNKGKNEIKSSVKKKKRQRTIISPPPSTAISFHPCNTLKSEWVRTGVISEQSDPASYRLQFHQEQHCYVVKRALKYAFIHEGLLRMAAPSPRCNIIEMHWDVLYQPLWHVQWIPHASHPRVSAGNNLNHLVPQQIQSCLVSKVS